MTPEQDETLVDLAFALDRNAGEQARVSAASELRKYVDSLLAQARADERERVITAMSEYLPADSRAKIAAAIRARKDA